ncbi:HNH endonuclease [Leptospira vanthielii]|uniref:HNH endonuclease n=1 Tax=Leptospira vanthielii serovar Holland str. Waz Holland = ATCC 700522 TaxID=1218591 RepID=N1WBB6_9LEPT|nr:HNH endonuclease [Leptospira vanthielii]EMY70482.1 HNH endonuclease [Leptospira vanthielii serovar Holland str. Waz Holland = ATCC 700522]
MNCYHTEKTHSSNTSKEHIFPQQIGGKFKVSGILCQKHNNSFGHTIEAELETKLNFFCILLDVDRNNKDKKYYLLETKDRVVKVFANRKGKLERPKVHIEKDKQGKILSINIEENSRLELEKKLKSIKEKHNLSDEIDKNSQIYDIEIGQKDFTENKINIPLYEKSVIFCIAKSIINFALSKGIEKKYIDNLIEFLCNNKPYPNYFTTHQSPLKNPNNVDNVIIIIGQNNKIIAYVQYLNLIKYYFVLTEQYSGPDFSFNFTENPEGRGHHEDTKFDISKITNAKKSTSVNLEEFKETFYPFMERVFFKRELNQLIDKHIENTIMTIGENATTAEFLNDFSYNFITEYINKFESQNGA